VHPVQLHGKEECPVASTDDPRTPDPQIKPRPTKRRFPAAYKERILAEYESLNKAGKGALLRREGLYNQLMYEWREQRDRDAKKALVTLPGQPKDDRLDSYCPALISKAQQFADQARNLNLDATITPARPAPDTETVTVTVTVTIPVPEHHTHTLVGRAAQNTTLTVSWLYEPGSNRGGRCTGGTWTRLGLPAEHYDRRRVSGLNEVLLVMAEAVQVMAEPVTTGRTEVYASILRLSGH
jgi:transposase-like protein